MKALLERPSRLPIPLLPAPPIRLHPNQLRPASTPLQVCRRLRSLSCLVNLPSTLFHLLTCLRNRHQSPQLPRCPHELNNPNPRSRRVTVTAAHSQYRRRGSMEPSSTLEMSMLVPPHHRRARRADRHLRSSRRKELRRRFEQSHRRAEPQGPAPRPS
jgi:hypothetical protein